MIRRRLAILVSVVAPVVLVGVASRAEPEANVIPTYATLSAPSMPFVPHLGFLSSAWFCPGVPIIGDGLGGSVTVVNPSEAPLIGHLTVFTDAPDVAPIEIDFEVPVRDTYVAQLDELYVAEVPKAQRTGSYLSALVEIAGGGGLVEQLAEHAAGDAVSPCANSTSATWYLADNYTLGDSREDIVITNPFPDDAIVNLSFATKDGTRSPGNLQSLPVTGNSIRVISQESLAKDEAILSVSVVASTGRVVVARAQRYRGERGGYSLSLAAPAPSSAWYFADGLNDGQNFERYSIYNPTGEDAYVLPVFYGLPADSVVGVIDEIAVPAGRVVSFSIADVPELPQGTHGLVFSSLNEVPVVIERAITKTENNSTVTTVVRGVEMYFAVPGYFRWSMAIGPATAAEGALVILNLSSLDAVVSVKTLGSGGEVVVPDLEAVSLPAGQIVRIAIPESAAAHPLVVTADQPIIVERLLPRGRDLVGRSGSLALPG